MRFLITNNSSHNIQQIRNGAKDMCLDSSADTSATNKPVKMWPCHNQGGNQVYQHPANGMMNLYPYNVQLFSLTLFL